MKLMNKAIRIIKRLVVCVLKIFDFNKWFEKLVYINTKINKMGSFGRMLSLVLNLLIRILFNCDVSPNIILGRNVKFPHAVGIVIGSTTIIGDNTVIMPNVVIGAKQYPPSNSKRHATIGINCLIGANAVIIGNINIGDNCIIAAGSRVTKSLDMDSKFI